MGARHASGVITVRAIEPPELATCLAVRREVFIEGQRVPEALEIDGLDGEAFHVLACDDDAAIGTARMRVVDGAAKIERVAVRAPYRGRGVGAKMMDALEAEAAQRGLTRLVLSAQVEVIPFYERRGYVAEGPEYLDADIPHRTMRRTVASGAELR